ncbi:MAG: Coenzyme F420 hydrogenase/dehydrogenase, beta subunit C-terminal domain [Candidatus Hydrothermarchaeales archaeon]
MEMEGLETFVPLMERSKGFEELKKTIIDQGLCSSCGVCAAFCERVEWKDEGPEMIGDCNMEIGAVKCNVNGICYDHCPHVSFSVPELEKEVFGVEREDKEIGYYKRAVAARSKHRDILEKAQDGGAVTSLLLCAIENGFVDGASIATRTDDWKVDSIVAKGKEDLLKGSGTKYTRAPSVVNFGKSLREVRRLAVVGTGCQMTGARKVERTLLNDIPNIELLNIGLFCFENFPYDGLKEKIESEFKVSIGDVVKTDITKGKFIIWTKDGKRQEKSVKVFDEHVPEACLMCTNFTSTFSDISVGSIGSEDGWSTVIVRTDKGSELLDKAVEGGYLEIKDKVDLEKVRRNTELKYGKRDAAARKREEEGKIVPDYS